MSCNIITNEKVTKTTSSNTELKSVTYSFKEVPEIGFEKGITRRDPSDVIKVNNVYYVYYTKVMGQASGYWGDIWYASSEDGFAWQEKGQILGVGEKGAFDSQAVFTPNIIKSRDKYYLFYTGVKPTPERLDGVFENNSITDITALGLAVADDPIGPFKRIGKEPILEISDNPNEFDSYRIDDAALLFKNNKYLLYYKGRSKSHGNSGPAHTQMGVAISNNPDGPYRKHPKPILDNSHEVMIWKQGEGVGALASISSTLEYSKTGLDFMTNRKNIKVENRPFAPGAFRPDLTDGEIKKLEWGISMVHNGPDCYLIRYDVIEEENLDSKEIIFQKGSFGYDKDFLQKHYKNTIVLESEDGKSGLVLSPELQGRVMTSTLNGNEGMSFGWLNYELIASGEIKEHINPTGGEERFWLGPEGGQFSIFFKPDSSFDFENWYVPAPLDTEAFDILSQNENSVHFGKTMKLMNWSGTAFDLNIERTVTLLSIKQIKEFLKLSELEISSVAYETKNRIENKGLNAWNKETGLLSVWLLSMLNPSPEVTVVAPIKVGSDEDRGKKVNDNYFGKISSDRLVRTKHHVFFKADGQSRGKIGLSPLRATKFIGSYDVKNNILTILEISSPNENDQYVNSAWEMQEDPFSGDALNSYNDGPLEDASQMGPFYELESSSPALALEPDESYTYLQRIYHFRGDENELNILSLKLLNISLYKIEQIFDTKNINKNNK